MEAQLEQLGPLQLGKAIGRMHPNPLTDDFGKTPLTDDATAKETKDLGKREGPALLMQRPTELARTKPERPARGRPNFARPTMGRLTNY